jgi:hypothetical protein
MITDISNVKQYAISGTPAASYEITFAFFTLADIVAYLTLSDGTTELLVIDTDYTLSAVGATGTLTRVGDWTAGCTQITIARLASLIQDVTFTQNTVLSALVLETLFDRLVAYIQQVKENISRTVTTPITEGSVSLELPSIAERAGKAMAFDLSGDITVSEYTDAVISTFMKGLIELTTAKDAQEYLGAVSAATADRVIIRDASGRAKVAAPSAGDDIAIKTTVTDHSGQTSAHGATAAATASRMMIRDASGRAQVADPSAALDIVNKQSVEAYIDTVTDQELFTTSSPTFADGTFATKLLSTYLGYLNQSLKTTDSPTFASVDTGYGANDVYNKSYEPLTVPAGSALNFSAMQIMETKYFYVTLQQNSSNGSSIKTPTTGTFYVFYYSTNDTSPVVGLYASNTTIESIPSQSSNETVGGVIVRLS